MQSELRITLKDPQAINKEMEALITSRDQRLSDFLTVPTIQTRISRDNNAKYATSSLNAIQDLSELIQELQGQWENLKELKDDLRLLKGIDGHSELGSKKGRNVIILLWSFAVLAVAVEVVIICLPFFLGTSMKNSSNAIAAGGFVASSAVGAANFFTKRYIDNVAKQKEIEKSKIDKVDETAAILQFFHKWKAFKDDPDSRQKEDECFSTLEGFPETFFESTGTKAEWVTAILASLPEGSSLNKLIEEALKAKNNSSSSSTLHDNEGDIESQKAPAKDEYKELIQKIKGRLPPQIVLSTIMYRGKRLSFSPLDN